MYMGKRKSVAVFGLFSQFPWVMRSWSNLPYERPRLFRAKLCILHLSTRLSICHQNLITNDGDS